MLLCLYRYHSHVEVRIAEGDTVFLEGGLYSIHNVEIYRPIILVLAPGTSGVGDVAVSEFLDVYDGRDVIVLDDERVIAEESQHSLLHLLHVVVVGNREEKFESAPIRIRVIDDAEDKVTNLF